MKIKIVQKIGIYSLLLSFVAFLGCPVPEKDVNSSEVFVVINPWFPYELWDEESNTIKGVTGEYVDLIFKNLGYSVTYKVEPSFDKALLMVATAEADSLYSLLQTPERTKIMLFSESNIIRYNSLFLINQEKNPDLVGTSIYDRTDKTVFGSVIGETESEYTIPRRANFIFIRTFQTYQELMEALWSGAIDVALMEEYNGIYEYNQFINTGKTFQLASTSDYTFQYLKIAFSPTPFGERLKKEFDEENEKLQATGILQELLIKYVGNVPAIRGYNVN